MSVLILAIRFLQWDVSEAPHECSKRLTLGLAINPEFAFNILDKGPAADSAEVSKTGEVSTALCQGFCTSSKKMHGA